MSPEILYAIIGVMATIIGVMILRRDSGLSKMISAISEKLDLFAANQAKCQIDNARTFATKEELRAGLQEVRYSVGERFSAIEVERSK